MSGNDSEQRTDLLVVITRLHVGLGLSGDEFIEDWASPDPNLNNYSVIDGSTKEHGYWAINEDKRAGVLIIHGHKGLFASKPGSFDGTINRHLDCSGLKDHKFANLTVLKHGAIPELDSKGENSTSSDDFLKSCSKLAERFPGRKEMHDYDLQGKRPASLEFSREQMREKIPQEISILIENFFIIGPAVEFIVRAMQHILLEIRLWFDLYASSEKIEKGGISIEERLKDCHDRLMGSDHWKNAHLAKALGFIFTASDLYKYLEARSQELYRQDDREPLKKLFQDLYESQGGREFLDCDDVVHEALAPLLKRGEPPEIPLENPEAFILNVDKGLRILSARLEVLIPAAVAEDHRRKYASDKAS